MSGSSRRELQYYQCAPLRNNRGRLDRFPDHPKAFYATEANLLDAVAAFYADRVFGPQRRAILAADLAQTDNHAAEQRHAERSALQHKIADLERRQTALLRQAQDGDPDDPFSRSLRQTFNELDAPRRAIEQTLAELDRATPADKPDIDTQGLLDALPYLTANLTAAPSDLLQRLFEITQLEIRFHDHDVVTITITLPGGELPAVADTAIAIQDHHDTTVAIPTQKTSGPPPTAGEPLVLEPGCTPDGIRTHATGVRGRRPRPLDDGGLLARRNLAEQRFLFAAGVPGLEPRLTEPESVVLPITPYPNGTDRLVNRISTAEGKY